MEVRCPTTSKGRTMTSTSNLLGLQVYNTTSTTTTSVACKHIVTWKTTLKRKNTSWPLVFTSTTSTSRTESATTCSTYLKHVYLLLPFSMEHHRHFPKWAREFRAYLGINQFEYIGLVDVTYNAEQPLTADTMVQRIPAGRQQHLELRRLRQALQELQDEFALPPL